MVHAGLDICHGLVVKPTYKNYHNVETKPRDYRTIVKYTGLGTYYPGPVFVFIQLGTLNKGHPLVN